MIPNPLVNLRNQIYFTWSRFNGNLVASIRQYFVNSNGDLLPTKKGISFGKRGYDDLKDIVFSGLVILDAAALDNPQRPAKKGLDPTYFVPAVAMSVYEQLAYTRYISCPLCNRHVHGQGEDIHTYVQNKSISPPQATELCAVIESARKQKTLEACVLEANEATPIQFVNLPFGQFYEAFDQQIRDKIVQLYEKSDAFVGTKFLRPIPSA